MLTKLTKNKQNELLKAGFKLGWQNLLIIARLLLPAILPFYLLYNFLRQPGASGAMVFLHVACLIVYIVLIPAPNIIITYTLNQRLQGQPIPTFVQSWDYCFSRLGWVWRVLLKSTLLILKGLFPRIVPGIRLSFQYTLVNTITIINPLSENTSAPLEESQNLIKGQEWAVFRLMILSFLLIFVLSFCIGLPLVFVETFWMNAILDSISQILVAPFSGMLLLLYQTLKEELPESHETLPNKN